MRATSCGREGNDGYGVVHVAVANDNGWGIMHGDDRKVEESKIGIVFLTNCPLKNNDQYNGFVDMVRFRLWIHGDRSASIVSIRRHGSARSKASTRSKASFLGTLLSFHISTNV